MKKLNTASQIAEASHKISELRVAAPNPTF